MSVFIFRRLLTLVATLAGASLIIFLVLDALPGNAAEMLMGADSSPEAVRAMTIKLGLDQPLILRYLHWIGGLLVGDLGNSYAYGTPVADLIAERLALTIPLAVLAMLLTVVLAALGAARIDVLWWGKVSTFALMTTFPLFLLTTNPHHAPLSEWQHVLRDVTWVIGLAGLALAWVVFFGYIRPAARALASGRAARKLN